MKVFGCTIALLVGLFGSLAFSLFVHTLYWGTLLLVTSKFVGRPHNMYIATALTVTAFIAGTYSAYKNTISSVDDLSWNSGTIQDAPSSIRVRGHGGYLWNINPLGFDSIGSMAKVLTIVLCLPMGIFFAILKAGLIEIRRIREA